MGQGGFVGVGAYVVGVLTVQQFEFDFWAALPCAIVITSALAYLLSYPLFRLRGYHFAIGTLAVGQLLYIMFDSWEWFTGGPHGTAGIARPALRRLRLRHQCALPYRGAFLPRDRGVLLVVARARPRGSRLERDPPGRGPCGCARPRRLPLQAACLRLRRRLRGPLRRTLCLHADRHRPELVHHLELFPVRDLRHHRRLRHAVGTRHRSRLPGEFSISSSRISASGTKSSSAA